MMLLISVSLILSELKEKKSFPYSTVSSEGVKWIVVCLLRLVIDDN